MKFVAQPDKANTEIIKKFLANRENPQYLIQQAELQLMVAEMNNEMLPQRERPELNGSLSERAEGQNEQPEEQAKSLNQPVKSGKKKSSMYVGNTALQMVEPLYSFRLRTV